MWAILDSRMLLVVGGLGLFLLGMLILTEGLKGLAGNQLRRWLARYTKTPVSGAATGALTTAIVQSSSATTVTAVGFVGAGLLTFSQALGIIFGANIGTTITGWLVAIGGFKLDLGYIVLPLVLVGTMMRLFGGGRWPQVGWALAGFSLLFVGIDTMQQGMEPLKGLVTPDDFPDDTLFGRFKLVLLGIAITLITQSSSAGVATALVALSAGAISFPQAAAMVIGMDVGTTFTAALATVGGSTAVRQTGFAHVIYNVLTGTMAFFLLGPFTELLGPWIAERADNPQIGLVAFHTSFNLLGVLVVLPFTTTFAHLIQRLVPEKDPVLTRRLDRRLLVDPGAASDATVATLRDIAVAEFGLLDALLRGEISVRERRDTIGELSRSLDQTRRFVQQVRTDPAHPVASLLHQDALHGLDHLVRLLHRCAQQERIDRLHEDHRLSQLAGLLQSAISAFLSELDWVGSRDRLERLDQLLRAQGQHYRARIIAQAAEAGESPERTVSKLDSLRWLYRVGEHVWRILEHLESARSVLHAAEIAANRAD